MAKSIIRRSIEIVFLFVLIVPNMEIIRIILGTGVEILPPSLMFHSILIVFDCLDYSIVRIDYSENRFIVFLVNSMEQSAEGQRS